MQATQRKATLPWMQVPLNAPADHPIAIQDIHGLHPDLAAALRRFNFPTLFPVQAAAWSALAGGCSSRHDLAISAPTGSGKTLAYALPLLQRCLAQPAAPPGHLRALVVVPTRALAQQVRSWVDDALVTCRMHANHVASFTWSLLGGTPTPPRPAMML